ncbi:MAG: S1C family serine protease [Patescibacteria group bacterium]
MSKINNTNRGGFWFIALVLSLILGFLGGIISFFYYKDFYSDYTFSSNLDLDYWQYGGSSFVIRDAKNVTISQDLKIEENLNYFNEAVVSFYDNKDLLLLDDGLFSGVVISSDGWVLVNTLGLNLDKNLDSKIKDYIAISKKSKKSYMVEDFSYNEKFGFLMVKLKGVNNFSVKNISGFQDLKSGKSVLLYNFAGDVDSAIISSINSKDSYINTDNFIREISISKDVKDEFKNSFVFDLDGNLLAMVSSDLGVYSLSNYRSAIFNFFKSKNFVDYNFGLTYVNLSNVFNADSNAVSEGAWIYNNNSLAVTKGSLADLSGIKTGDIITMVNDYKIDSRNDLFDVLNSFATLDNITLQVVRGGELLNISMILE